MTTLKLEAQQAEGGGGGGDVTKQYVDQGDSNTLSSAKQYTDTAVSGKQNTLTAGANITIVNDVISATGSTTTVVWGGITGDLSDQTDLSTALGAKQNTLTAGANISIDANNEISATANTIFYMNASESGLTRHIYKNPDMTGAATSQEVFDANNNGQVILRISTSQTPEMYSDAYLQNAYKATGDYQLLFLDEKTYRSFDTTSLSDSVFTYSSRVIQDKITAGTNIQINGATISATDTTYSDFSGATTLVAGSAGLVPAPTTADPDKFLKGDGTWQTPPGTTYTAGTNVNISAQNVISAIDTTYTDFVGTDGITDGDNGLVPAPITSDVDKYLKSDGTWATVASGGSTITLTNTDPGEGSPLAADNFIGVYGGVVFNGDYSLTEASTGTTWIDGKTIYKITVSCGTVPSAGTTTTDISSLNVDYIVGMTGMAANTSLGKYRPLPFVGETLTNMIRVDVDGNAIRIVTPTSSTWNNYDAYVTLYYTKSV